MAIAITLVIVVAIEASYRAGVKWPGPFFVLLLSVILAGWKAGKYAGACCGLIAALYILYVWEMDHLFDILPSTNQGVLFAALLFSGSGILFAYLKAQHEQLLINVIKHDAELQKKDAIYQTLAEASQDVIVRYDKNLRHTYVNPAIYQITGKRPQEYLGKTIHECDIKPELCHVYENSLKRVFATGKPDCFIYEATGLDGSRQLIDWQAYPEFGSDGDIESVVKVSRNITERRAYEQHQQRIRHLEALGVFAGGIAHDFNNILTVLSGKIGLLEAMLPGDHTGHVHIKAANEAFERARSLSRKIMTFSKGGDPEKEILHLETLIKEIVDLDLSDSGIQATLQADRDLWPVEADRGQMQQVFSNLVVNARQAMQERGRLSIKLKNVHFQKRRFSSDLHHTRYVRITVRDEGSGIDTRHLNRIFDPYFTTKDTGNGLGLATVYSIVAKHDGYISVKSRPGKGTVFSIHIPATEAGMDTRVQASEAESASPKTGKLLFVDDDEIICDLAKTILEGKGYTVEVAKEGGVAVAKYQEALDSGAPFDCVIMDLSLQDGPGGEQIIRDLQRIDPNVKAIAASGLVHGPATSQYGEHGFKAFLPKPFTKQSLTDIIQKVIA